MKKLLIVVTMFFCFNAFAEDPAITLEASSMNFGGLVGFGFSSAGTTQWQAPHFGVRISKQVYSNKDETLYIGAFATTSQATQIFNSLTGTGTTTTVSAEVMGRYLYGSKFFGGGRFGMAMRTFNVTDGTNSASFTGSAFNVGPFVGYEITASEKVFVDLDIHWNTVWSSIMVGTTGSYQSLAVSTFLFSVVFNLVP